MSGSASRSLLVTGGSGYLGSELVRQALGSGWEVMATHLTREPPPGADAVRLDVRDEAAVSATVERFIPDTIVHTAYLQESPEAESVNVEGAAVVARAAAATGARLVHMSTDLIFDGRLDRAYREEDEARPVMAYGEQKLRAEQEVATACPGAAIVRTSLIYGGPAPSPHERTALEAARGEREMAFFEDELRCPVRVSDLARALLELAELGFAGPIHIAGADTVTRLGFARLVVAAAGLDPDSLRGASSEGLGRPQNCALDCSLAASLLRKRPAGVRQVLG